jgi:hypothetical protein
MSTFLSKRNCGFTIGIWTPNRTACSGIKRNPQYHAHVMSTNLLPRLWLEYFAIIYTIQVYGHLMNPHAATMKALCDILKQKLSKKLTTVVIFHDNAPIHKSLRESADFMIWPWAMITKSLDLSPSRLSIFLKRKVFHKLWTERSTTHKQSWLPIGISSNLLYVNLFITTLIPRFLASPLTSLTNVTRV